METQPYRAIFLTDEGRAIAEKSKARHRVVTAVLVELGVPEEIADADAEGMEHYISEETLGAFERFLSARENKKN